MEYETLGRLLKAARSVRANAYAPYSHFRVGAALLASDGTIYTGCNVENVSYGATMCAERNALGAAVADGKTRFTALCIAAGSEEILPCGICRQALCEFAPDLEIFCADETGVTRHTLAELLPHSFSSFTPQT